MRNSFYLIILFFAFTLSSLSALEDEKPLWVEFEEAKNYFETGEFQKSLEFFLEVTKRNVNFPEAEYMVGMIYLEEGELQIAEEQVKRAIELSPFLQVSQDLLEYRYTLARIYLLKSDYENYISTLKSIISVDSLDPQKIRDQKAYYETLIESGLDRLIHLYREDADNVLNARLYLGYYYNSIGEYKESVNYLLTPMLALLTEVINDNSMFNREYVFTSVDDLFNGIKSSKRISLYFEENDFYKLFYYLGESLYGIGEVDRAIEFWTLLKKYSPSIQWSNKAARQLKEPLLEEWKFIY